MVSPNVKPRDMKEIQEWMKRVQPDASNDPETAAVLDDIRSRLEDIIKQPEINLRVVSMMEAIPTYGFATHYHLKASVLEALRDMLVLVSVSFYCKVCKRNRMQAIREENRTGFMPCHWCNDYWIYLVPIVTGGKPDEVKERFRYPKKKAWNGWRVCGLCGKNHRDGLKVVAGEDVCGNCFDKAKHAADKSHL